MKRVRLIFFLFNKRILIKLKMNYDKSFTKLKQKRPKLLSHNKMFNFISLF